MDGESWLCSFHSCYGLLSAPAMPGAEALQDTAEAIR
jgi:hypothetical protein